MEVTGKVTNIYPAETVGDKQKQTFTIKTTDQYPKDIAFECWGKTLDYVAKANVGNEVTVSFDVSSREYNNRWYSTIKAFKIVVNGGTAQTQKESGWEKFNGAPAEDGLPF